MSEASEIKIGNAGAVVWLIAGLVVIIGFAIARVMRNRARKKFATHDRVNEVFAVERGTSIVSWLRGVFVLLTIALLTLGLMDWRWGKTQREVPQKGIEIMFLLDVSRSMLAQDVTPNRLERAKQMIRDMVGAMAGDRVGLVAFAGETRRIIPLTNHYEDFNTALADIGPDSLRRGGSRLGDAIQAGGDGFLSKTNSYRVMIVLTDGEDQESRPAEMAKQLHADLGIRIFTVGLGDVTTGAKIPDEETQRYVRYQGEPVVSKLNGEILQQVAEASQGAYIPAGTKQVDMKAVYERYIAGFEKSEFDTVKIDTYEARFQWFALPALILLMIEGWMIGGRRKSQRPAAAILFMIFAWGPGNDLPAQSLSDDRAIYNRGVEAYQADDFEAAIESFDHTSRSADERVAASARYNAGTTRIAIAAQAMQTGQSDPVQENLELAIASLRSALRLRPRWDDARANLEKAVRMLDQLSSDEPQSNPGDAGDADDEGEPNESQEQPESQNPDGENSDGENSDGENPDGENSKPSENDPNSKPQGNASNANESPQPDDSPTRGEPSNPRNESEPPGESESSGAPESSGESRQPDGSNPTEDAESLPSPDGELDSDNLPDPSQMSQTSETGDAPSLSQAMSMTQEEAQKMLQAVRDRDMIRRFRQQQFNRTRQVPVDKDW